MIKACVTPGRSSDLNWTELFPLQDMLAELRRVFLPPEHKLWTFDCDVDQNGSCSRDEISFLLLRICHHWHLFCDARRLQSNCQSNDVWSGRGDYFDHSAFCKLESNNSLNWTTSGRAGISWVCIKHCQRHNGPEGWVHLAKVRLQVQTQILIEFHLQNLDSAST